MNLKELSQLDIKDLKNIDYKSLLENLKKRPDILIIVVLVLSTLSFCFIYFSGRRAEFTDLSNEVSVLEKQWAAYQEYQKTQDVLDALKSVLPPKVSEASLIEIITAISETTDIKITSFSSAKEESHDTYTSLTMSIDATAPNYNALWNFIYGIETQSQSIRIDRIEINKTSGGRSGYRSSLRTVTTDKTENPSEFGFQLTITGINFTNA